MTNTERKRKWRVDNREKYKEACRRYYDRWYRSSNGGYQQQRKRFAAWKEGMMRQIAEAKTVRQRTRLIRAMRDIENQLGERDD